jgi:G:T-mismatch repair DNA endonuclease (very short patch repair protein)
MMMMMMMIMIIIIICTALGTATDKWYTHTQTEVTPNRPDIIIKNTKTKNICTHGCGSNHGQKYHAKGKRRKTETQELMYTNTMNVEHEMYDYKAYN